MSFAGTTTPEAERDEYRTPRYLFYWAQDRFGLKPSAMSTFKPRFSVDLAATEHNKLCDKFTPDAFAEPWDGRHGHDAWCNPPYSDITPWLRKAIESTVYGFRTTFLLPSLNGASHDRLVLQYASKIVFIVGRIAFVGADGNPYPANNRGSIFVHFDAESLHKCEPSYVMRDDMIRRFERER